MSGAEGPLRIAVAGGSIGGLCAGLALRGAGFNVQVYERVSGPMETRGAGIVVQGELIELLRTHGKDALPTTHCTVRRYLSPEGGAGKVQRAPQDFTSWEAIYRTLAAAFPSDRYHRGATLMDFANGDGVVRAHIDSHGAVEVDVLVAADGAQSQARRRLLPDLSSTYAGYVAWRGTLDEADAPPDLVRFFDDAFTFSEARSAGHILAYFIPGDGADTTPESAASIGSGTWVSARPIYPVSWSIATGASTTPRFRSALRRTRPSPTSAISPGAKCTRCWRPWWPQLGFVAKPKRRQYDVSI